MKPLYDVLKDLELYVGNKVDISIMYKTNSLGHDVYQINFLLESCLKKKYFLW